MKIATRTFVAEVDGERIQITAERDRVAPDHPIVQKYPQHFRTREVSEELAIRSARIAELEDRATRVSYEPLSRAGREERKQEEFWRSVDRQLNRDDRSPEERAEQAFYDRATAQLEESDARELAEINDEAVRDYRFDRGGWARRTAD